MALKYIYYILVTALNKDDFVVHGEPTINIFELLEEEGFGEGDIIVELDRHYEGEVKILYKWDTKFNKWQMIN
jgi:hypothetical protein